MQSIHLTIRKREFVLVDEDVTAFTSINEKGEFDILYKHENFISLINQNCVIHKLDGTKKEIKIQEGIVRAHDNTVTVFLGISS